MISVCVATYRRPDGLRRLLAGLAGQRDPGSDVEIVVIDNDAAGSAAAVVDQARAELPGLRLVYAVEPERNIAGARNAAVRLAAGDRLAFIDDDEIPAEGWLAHHAEAQSRYRCDGTFGPVLPILPVEAPGWVARGGFHDRPRHSSGETIPVDELRTGNAFVRAALLTGRAGPFDRAYGRTGGEDTDLFAALVGQRAHFVWCDEAVVHETIPAERTTLRWLLQRSFRGGQSYALRRRAAAGWAVGLALALAGLAVFAGSLAGALVALPFGCHRAVWCLRKGASGLGKAVALTPFRWEEYGDTELKRLGAVGGHGSARAEPRSGGDG